LHIVLSIDTHMHSIQMDEYNLCASFVSSQSPTFPWNIPPPTNLINYLAIQNCFICISFLFVSNTSKFTIFSLIFICLFPFILFLIYLLSAYILTTKSFKHLINNSFFFSVFFSHYIINQINHLSLISFFLSQVVYNSRVVEEIFFLFIISVISILFMKCSFFPLSFFYFFYGCSK